MDREEAERMLAPLFANTVKDAEKWANEISPNSDLSERSRFMNAYQVGYLQGYMVRMLSKMTAEQIVVEQDMINYVCGEKND